MKIFISVITDEISFRKAARILDSGMIIIYVIIKIAVDVKDIEVPCYFFF